MSASLDSDVEARLTANSSTTKGGKLFKRAGTAYALGAGELCRKRPATRQTGMALAGSAKRSIDTPICCHRRGKGSEASRFVRAVPWPGHVPLWPETSRTSASTMQANQGSASGARRWCRRRIQFVTDCGPKCGSVAQVVRRAKAPLRGSGCQSWNRS
jgi:hypothetical protein